MNIADDSNICNENEGDNLILPMIQLEKIDEPEKLTLEKTKTKSKINILPKIKGNIKTAANLNTKLSRNTALLNFQNSIENYKIDKEIGHGSCCLVMSAISKITGNRVAIKGYDKYKLLTSHRKLYVKREIGAMKLLNHKNIVKLLEVIDTPKEIFLVIELAEGMSLIDYMKSKPNKQIIEKESVIIFKQIMEGINHCHEKNVIHRDIKMDNIIIDKNLNVKIIDFGFSTWINPGQKLKLYCGTPSYMPPEIVTKKEYYGPPVDIWSLGVLLYAMLTGVFPYTGVIEQDIYKNILRGVFNVPSYLSNESKNLINKMIILDPEQRPTAEEVLRNDFFL